MTLAKAALIVLLSVGATVAQTIQGDNSVFRIGPDDVVQETRERVVSAPTAILRGLDKTSGMSRDLEIERDDPIAFGALSIVMRDCRYPEGNPNGDAYVNLLVAARNTGATIFEGWMVASSPALMALDHPRYDVWAIRCKLDDRSPSVVAGESSPYPTMRPAELAGN